MRLHPSGETIPLPPDSIVDLKDVVWTFKPPSKTWEIQLAWMTLELSDEEFCALLKCGCEHAMTVEWVDELQVAIGEALEQFVAREKRP